MIRVITICFMCLVQWTGVTCQTILRDVQDAIALARQTNVDLRSGEIQLDQARKSRIAALLSIPDIGGSLGFSYTHNTRLPVSLFPAEIFGGQPGEYREVQTGVPYNSLFNENIDIKLINPKGWQNLKLSNITIKQQEVANRVTARDLDAAVSRLYFDILTLKEQEISAASNLRSASELLGIVSEKYTSGIIREQDLLDAKSNYIISMDNHQQIGMMIEEQLNSFRILCDVPYTDSLVIIMPDLRLPLTDFSVNAGINLDVVHQQLAADLAKANYSYHKMSLLPTLSFFQNYSNQQFSVEGKIFNRTVDWIPSSYIGLRLLFQVPSSSTIGQISKYKYDALIAQQRVNKEKIRVVNDQQQRLLAFEKYKEKTVNDEEIYGLRKRAYARVVDLYREGLIGIDRTLDSYKQMVDAGYSAISSKINVLRSFSQIQIYNQPR